MNFDWTTFALQLVNVLVLLAILRHFLFRPVARIIEQRRADTQAALDAAKAVEADAKAAMEKARGDVEELATTRQELLSKASDEAERQRAALLDKAREEARQIIEDGRAARAREDAAAERHAVARIRDLAAAVAHRALAAQPDHPGGYAQRLVAALERMAPPGRDALLKGGNLTLVTAGEMPEAVLDTVRHTLESYGATASLVTDTGLIRGIELRSDSGVLRNSLAHDLETLSTAMHDVQTAS